jgi:hypothetical protein
MPTHSEALVLIQQIKDKLKKNEIIQKSFADKGLDVNEIDDIPVCFAPLEVSARTDHGIVYLNEELWDEPEEIDHYLAHEFEHFAQQTTGDGPTKGSTEDNYLDNEFEQEGFQTQTEYLSDTRGDEVAEDYIEDVMEHHEVPDKEKKKRKRELLQLAAWCIQVKLG